MNITVNPSRINGTITAPASKSAMQRACAAALIKGGITVLKNPGISADDQAALQIIRQLGAYVAKKDNEILIDSRGIQPEENKLHCGESGLSIRMFTSIAAVSNQSIHISGNGSLLKRPMHFFNEVLPQLKVSCDTNNGYLPIVVHGPLCPKDITIDGSLSSQYLTGLLFAYAAANAKDVTINVENLASKPYIDITLDVMKSFGLKVPENNNYKAFYFDQSDISYNDNKIEFTVEGDWSGAAFLLVAGAIGGSVKVMGLNAFSSQADKAILQALMQTGAILSIEEKQISVQTNRLKAFYFDGTDCPDLFPPLVALAAYCDGISVIKGVHRLTHKESNRAETLQQEFGKLGIEITLQDDLMVIRGGKVNGAVVNAHHDHRIAMACAVAALNAEGAVVVEGADAVNKSYPQFWDHLQQLQEI